MLGCERKMFDSHLHDAPLSQLRVGKMGIYSVERRSGFLRFTVSLFKCWMFETNLRLLRFTTKLIP
jgi:hypothetical protein